jgi:protein SCO1
VTAKKILTAFLVAVFAAVITGVGVLSVQQPQKKSLPVYGETGNFRLTAARGQAFDSIQLRGKVWITTFFFTTCSGICPVMTRNLKSLQERFGSYKDLEFVSISVNPEQDTPQALSVYARKYGADMDRWHFLTGAREDITRIAVHGFKVGDIREPVFHSSYFVLVDRNARIRGYYEGTRPEEMERLSGDLIRLIGTARKLQ